MTFTVWEGLDQAVRFAYRSAPHKGIVKDVRDRRLLTDSMFIRTRPFAVEGAWPSRSRFSGRFERFGNALAPRRAAPAAAPSPAATRRR